ncbi:MAG: Ppx/GppA phosphatase family protein [Candidatus Cloacimonadota bacterium]|nr:Ppx/GppA phosphatase family protein [Candidatus Cloacimonadota bacterium]
MNKYAILDIGTNSIKFFVFSIEDGKSTTIIEENNISRLGEGLLKNGIISDEAMERNIEALQEFLELAKKEKVEEITAVGTMCLRTAKNSKVFIDRAKKELDLHIEVIPGKEEARLSYLSVLSTIGKTDKDIVVFDTGGGSTEFIFGEGANIENRFSLDLGAVYPTENFLKSNPVTQKEIEDMLDYMNVFFEKKLGGKRADFLVGIGGTVTSMGAVMHKMTNYDPSIIQGSHLTLEEVNNQIKMYKNKTIEERKQIAGLQPKRADVILAGAGIVKTVLELFKIDKFTISDRGLRHGLMFDKYIK